MLAFLYSPLLWGLLFVALPVLIHLINMLRHRRIEWAAIEFLLLSQKKNRTWVLIKQLLLLLLRMAAVAAIVLLVAQPRLQEKWSGWLGENKTHHIILLDDSYSMSSTRGDKNLFDSGKEVVRQIVETASDSQRPQALTLARFSHLAAALLESEDPTLSTGKKDEKDSSEDKQAEKPKETPATEPATDDAAADLAGDKTDAIKKHFDFASVDINAGILDTLKKRLDAMKVSESDAGVKESLHVIEPLLVSDEQVKEDRVIYLVTDFRKRDWETSEAIRTALQNIAGKGARVELIDCSTEDKTNLAITKLKPVPGIIAAGVPCSVEVSVKNYGKTPAQGVTISIEQDDIITNVDKIEEQIGPGEEKSKIFTVRFSTSGPHAVTAKIDMDSIIADNRRFLILDVEENVPVLVIDGSIDKKKDSKSLVLALAPGGEVKTGIQPRVESPLYLKRGALDLFSAIYFTDTMPLDKEVIDRLENYAAAGGNVIFFTGPSTTSADINENLYRSGEGIFPVKLKGIAKLMPDPIQRLPDVEPATHPLSEIFDAKFTPFLDKLIVNKYMSVDKAQRRELKRASAKKETQENPPDPKKEVRQPPRVIATLRGGAPFVIGSTFGEGRVITILSTAAPVWNNWAIDNLSYVVALQEIQSYLSRHEDEGKEHKVGQPLRLELDANEYLDTVYFAAPEPEDEKLSRPQEAMAKIPATKTDDGRLIATFSGTDSAGVYKIQVTSNKNDNKIDELRKTAVNVEPSEGDLERFGTEKLDGALSGVKFQFAQASEFDANADNDMGTNLQNTVLILLILMLLGEQVLAWSCSYHLPSRGKGGDE